MRRAVVLVLDELGGEIAISDPVYDWVLEDLLGRARFHQTVPFTIAGDQLKEIICELHRDDAQSGTV